MVTVADNIFVTGGNAGLNKRVDVHDTEMYSILSNQWTVVQSLPLPQSEAGCVLYQNKIYVLGGYSWAHQKCVNTIQAYDPNRDQWDRPGSLPIELSGLRCALLTIPYSMTQALSSTHASSRQRMASDNNRSPWTIGGSNERMEPVSMPWATSDREALNGMREALQQEAESGSQRSRGHATQNI